jgi:hypothetical protein
MAAGMEHSLANGCEQRTLDGVDLHRQAVGADQRALLAMKGAAVAAAASLSVARDDHQRASADTVQHAREKRGAARARHAAIQSSVAILPGLELGAMSKLRLHHLPQCLINDSEVRVSDIGECGPPQPTDDDG